MMEVHPKNIETLLTIVQCWQADLKRWQATGPTGVKFPPKWPLTYQDTAQLIMLLAEMREKPEPTTVAILCECGRELHDYKGPLCRYCDGTAE